MNKPIDFINKYERELIYTLVKNNIKEEAAHELVHFIKSLLNDLDDIKHLETLCKDTVKGKINKLDRSLRPYAMHWLIKATDVDAEYYHVYNKLSQMSNREMGGVPYPIKLKHELTENTDNYKRLTSKPIYGFKTECTRDQLGRIYDNLKSKKYFTSDIYRESFINAFQPDQLHNWKRIRWTKAKRKLSFLIWYLTGEKHLPAEINLIFNPNTPFDSNDYVKNLNWQPSFKNLLEI